MRQSYHEHASGHPHRGVGGYDSSPNYIVSPDRDSYTVQRKLSPAFPTIDEANARRRNRRNALIARAGLVLAGGSVLVAVFTDTPAVYSGGSGVIGFLIFGVTCWLAAEHRRR